jgi:hypothetical protein
MLLLGELTKCNLITVEMLEESLIGDQFRIFMDIVLSTKMDIPYFIFMLFNNYSYNLYIIIFIINIFSISSYYFII